MKKRLLFVCKLLLASVYCLTGVFVMCTGSSLLVNIKMAGLEGVTYFLCGLFSVCTIISGCSVVYLTLSAINRITKNYLEDDK